MSGATGLGWCEGDWVEIFGGGLDGQRGRVALWPGAEAAQFKDPTGTWRVGVRLLLDDHPTRTYGFKAKELKRHIPTEDEELAWCLKRLA